MYSVFLLFIAIIYAQTCKPGTTRLVLNFEEFYAPYGTWSLPRPYNGLVFKRINTPYTNYPNDLTQVINTTYQPQYFPELIGTSSSPPNGIYTSGEIMTVDRPSQANSKSFTLLGLKISSVFINNLQIYINTTVTSAQGKQTLVSSSIITINVGSITNVLVNQTNIEGFSISCVNYTNCAQIIYDDIDLCM